MTPKQWEGIAEAARQAKKGMLQARPEPRRRVALFYGERYANWIQNHSEYDNEDSLAGVVRTLDELGVPFDIVSEDCISDLGRYKTLIVSDDTYMSHDASDAVGAFIEKGGMVLAEEDVAWFDLRGRALEPAWKTKATLLPTDSLRRLRPKEEGITLDDKGKAAMGMIRDFIKKSSVTDMK